jgi:hypothetical protein
MISASPPPGPGKDIVERLTLTGRLKELRWVKVSQHEPPNIAAAAEGDVVYGVRTSDQIVKAQNRKTK